MVSMDMDSILISLGVGLVFGIISAAVAEFRDMSRGQGFMFGFFLGIFGLIIVCIMKKPEEKNPAIQNVYPAMVTCYCGQAIPADSPACPYCRTVFSQVAPTSTVQSNTSAITKTGPLRNCLHCGKPLSRHANFCKYCGSRV